MARFATALLAVAAVIPAALAAPAASSWQRSEEVEALFTRQSNNNGWAGNYPSPSAIPPTNNLPQAWLDRLKQVTSQPNFPTYNATQLNGGYPLYSNGKPGTDPSICSFTYGCVEAGDIYNGPDGVMGISFDDGPNEQSSTLYPFLQQNNITATHFMIGSNIYWGRAAFNQAMELDGHIAVHTWSHPYMTTLTNEQIVAELGYTMQIIYEASGGRVAAFWRPPYGDVDNRVRAIASGVFGLRTVVWNKDTGDWAIGTNPQYTHDSVIAQYTQWLQGSKSPGLVVLEHEIKPTEVAVFLDIYPIMKQNNWNTISIAQAFDLPFYQNADDSLSDIAFNMSIISSADLAANGTMKNPGSGSLIEPSSSSSAVPSSSSTVASSSTAASSSSSSASSSESSRAAATSSAPAGAQNATSGAPSRFALSSAGLAGLIGVAVALIAL